MRNKLSKLSKKTKVFLSVASAAITNVAVTTLLTSCSLAKKDGIIDTCGLDKKYNINDATYARMEEDFDFLYKSQLDQRKASGEINDNAYNLELCKFRNNLNSIHASLHSGENKTLSYTIKTEALQSYARKNYNLFLKRSFSNISVSDFREVLHSYLSFFKTYCSQVKCDADLSTHLYNTAKTYGDNFINELVWKQSEKDLIVEMRNFQEGLTLVSLSDINSKISEYEASRQLSEFFDTTSVIPLKTVGVNYTWDELYNNPFFNTKSADISSYINHMFRMTRKDIDGNEFSIDFTNDVIPGYILKPKMKEMKSVPEKNIYSINIDWEISKADVHKFYDDANLLHSDFTYEKVFSTEYELPISRSYELSQLNDIYLKNIKLSWDDADNCAKEEFFTPDNSTNVENDLNSLARAGLKINNIRLDSLNLDGNISLDKPLKEDASLEQKFVNNCTLYAKTEVSYDDSNSLKSDFYAGFLHSYSATDNDVRKQEHTFNFQQITNSDMLVSKKFYENAVEYYNKVLESEIHSFSQSMTTGQMIADSQATLEYCLLGISALTMVLIASSLAAYIASFGLNVIEIISAIVLGVQYAMVVVATGMVLSMIWKIKALNNKYEEFAGILNFDNKTMVDYPKIIADTPSAQTISSKSTNPFIKRVENDHYIFETRKEFSKTHGNVTPNDALLYYKDINSNSENSTDSDYRQYNELKKELGVSQDKIYEAWSSNLEKQEGGLFTQKATIIDEIQSVLFYIQLVVDVAAIVMSIIALSPSAAAALGTQRATLKIVIRSIVRFVANLVIMQFLPMILQEILGAVISGF